MYVYMKLMRRYTVSQLSCVKPAGMAANENSIEALTLQEHYTTLVEGLKTHAIPVADTLYSRWQISFQELQAIHQINLTAMERSQALVHAVQNAIILNTGVYFVFMEVLGERGCASSLLDKLRTTYGTYYIPWMNQLLVLVSASMDFVTVLNSGYCQLSITVLSHFIPRSLSHHVPCATT